MIEGRGEESFKRGSGQAEPGLGYEASGSLSSGRFFFFWAMLRGLQDLSSLSRD